MEINKVAVVTGSNKGIGLGIVKELCKRGVKTVYLTSRDVRRGLKAVEDLKKYDLNPQFYQLDITNPANIEEFANHLKLKHGGLDILINNAAILPNIFTCTYEDSKRVIDTNYRSILTIQQYLFPILNDNARVINISSSGGHISNLKNTHWINELTKEDLTVNDIDAFIDWFLDSVKNNSLNKDDFCDLSIISNRVSKIALCALTRVQQKQVGKGISVNSMHPGYVQTDMTRHIGFMTVEEASKTPVYLALDADQSTKGKYIWFDNTEKEWTDSSLKLCPLPKIQREAIAYMTRKKIKDLKCKIFTITSGKYFYK